MGVAVMHNTRFASSSIIKTSSNKKSTAPHIHFVLCDIVKSLNGFHYEDYFTSHPHFTDYILTVIVGDLHTRIYIYIYIYKYRV